MLRRISWRIRVRQIPPALFSERHSYSRPRIEAGESRVFNGIEFVWIPAGEFRMGSTSRHAEPDEKPVTRVRITRGFWLGKYEVTQRQWQGVMGQQSLAIPELRR